MRFLEVFARALNGLAGRLAIDHVASVAEARVSGQGGLGLVMIDLGGIDPLGVGDQRGPQRRHILARCGLRIDEALGAALDFKRLAQAVALGMQGAFFAHQQAGQPATLGVLGVRCDGRRARNWGRLGDCGEGAARVEGERARAHHQGGHAAGHELVDAVHFGFSCFLNLVSRSDALMSITMSPACNRRITAV
ncbi:MAG: hypothetical protein IPO29_13605 [Anaerolineae bacterium]|nr:hypothetical protein [Anaerolineae bacterium]